MKARPGLLLLGLVILAVLGWQASDFIEQDRCLDGGGCWDYSRGACQYEDQWRCADD